MLRAFHLVHTLRRMTLGLCVLGLFGAALPVLSSPGPNPGLTPNLPQLSNKSQVSLITCGPGNDLYSTFGHSAIHIFDPASGIDRVYNYGTFDFDTENFYLKFTRGKLEYILSVSTFKQFVYSYLREGRWVERQTLNFDKTQKQQLFVFLEWNALPENRAYKYDFFYDNCSTRIRDVLENVLGKSLSYPLAAQDTTATFRQLIQRYLGPHPWSDLGIDLALGLPCDDDANYRQKMFLPDYLMAGMGEATLGQGDDVRPLVASEGVVLEQNPALDLSDSGGIVWIFWTLFVISLLATILVPAFFMRWFDIVLFAAVGLLGVFILLLWFATDHTATNWNLNLLWALPTWLYPSYKLLRRHIIYRLHMVHALWLFLLIVFWALLPQSFHPAVMPIILTLAARSWAWIKLGRHIKATMT